MMTTVSWYYHLPTYKSFKNTQCKYIAHYTAS